MKGVEYVVDEKGGKNRWCSTSKSTVISGKIFAIREAIEVCLMDETPDLDNSTTFVGLRDLELAI